MTPKTLLASLLALTLPIAAQAHRAWVLPAATVLSGEDPWVTFDAAISNDIFFFNYHGMGLDNLVATAPDGTTATLQNPNVGKHRSTFDLQLIQQGTYRIGMASSGLRARWQTADGEQRFWPGRGETPAPGDFERAVPRDASNLEVTQSSRRLETFVTAGAPTDGVLAISGQGLEMQAHTHPNDLYAGESARFRFLMDGEAAAGAKVTVIPAGMRYRNDQQDIVLTTDQDGVVEIAWPRAGRYWLEAEYGDDRVLPPASRREGSYVVTLEVLPL